MVILTEEAIVEQWAALLDGCEGEEEGILRRLEAELLRRKVPEISWQRTSIGPSYTKALSGKRRDGLAIDHPRFPHYKFVIMARDYGTSLDVCWYVTGSTKTLILRLLSRVPFVGLFIRMFGLARDLDMLDLTDLRAYVMSAHRSLRIAIEQLHDEKKLEISVDWRTRGILGIS